MLQNKINNCSSLIDEVLDLKDKEGGKDRIAKRNNRFFDAFSNYLMPLLTSLIALRNLPEYHFPENISNELQKYLKITKETLIAKKVNNPEAYSSNLFKLNSDFSNAWKNIANGSDGELLCGLAILRPLRPDINQIINCIERVKNWPVSDDAVRVYQSAKAKGEELLSEMSFDEEIENFLQKVSDKRASLLDLNEKVLKWIKEEQLEEKFLLSVR